MEKSISGSTRKHSDRSSSPIFRLDNDVLGYIFSLNADLDQKTEGRIPALLTLRYTSQVCSGWRSLALESPSLWAQVINLRFLAKSRDEWRIEVMRRTGTALLHIKSISDGWNSTDMDFVQRIVNDHWNRIQRLHLVFNFRPVEDGWHHTFQRPAPSLESFIFSWPDWPYRDEHSVMAPDFALFANQAPLLRRFSAGNMTHHLATLAVPNLRDLRLHPSISAFELLSALRHMPLLEQLEASIFGPPALLRGENIPPGSHSQISLPRLKDIKFTILYAIDDILSLLTHINPANGCALDFTGSYNKYRQETADHQSVARHGEIISRYSKYNAEVASATDLLARLESSCANLSVKFDSRRLFRFHVYSGTGFPEHTASTFLRSLITLRPDNIKTLKFFTEPIEPFLSNPDIKQFLLGLLSVETLTSNPRTLDFFQKFQSDVGILIIPALVHIELDSIDNQTEVSLIVDYLNSRIALGALADALTLKIRKCVGLDITALRSIPGLMLELVPGSQ